MPKIVSNAVEVFPFRRGSVRAGTVRERPHDAQQEPLVDERPATSRWLVPPRAAAEFLLLQRRPGDYLGGTWHAVHGSIEVGETAVQGALRELHEEAGLRPLALWQLDFVSTFYMAGQDTIRLEPCFAAETASDATVTLSSEHGAYRWVAAERIAEQLMWPNQRRAVREIMEEIIRPGSCEPHLRIDLTAQ